MSRTLERRAALEARLEIRSDDSGSLTLAGYAAVFDVEAHREIVRPTAFSRALRDGHDVRLLVNHDGVPLARTRSGTLRLSTDERGLAVEADLDPENPTVRELRSALDRGDIDQMSFAFRTIRDSVDDAGLRELHEVELWDVSVVTYPWYDATSAQLHGRLDELVEARGADAVAALLDQDSEEDVPSREPVPAVRLEAARTMFPRSVTPDPTAPDPAEGTTR